MSAAGSMADHRRTMLELGKVDKPMPKRAISFNLDLGCNLRLRSDLEHRNGCGTNGSAYIHYPKLECRFAKEVDNWRCLCGTITVRFLYRSSRIIAKPA